MNFSKAFLCACSAALLAACTAGEVYERTDISDEVVALNASFEQAATEFGVPVELLKAIGYVETRWSMVKGHDDHNHNGMEAAHGVMALRGDRIMRGAELAGVSENAVETSALHNVRAAAALLAQEADTRTFDRSDLGAWAEAVGGYSNLTDDNARHHYVVKGVYGVLATGARLELEGGHLVASLDAISVEPDYQAPPALFAAGTADYPDAIWRPSGNNSARSSGSIGNVAMVIIHTCEGSYAGCWSWLRNSAAGASAHYVINESGSETTQLVREARKAWHISADYSCSRNSGVDCWRNGYNSNNFTIGIEHAGYASQSSFADGQLEASARLVCDITRDHGIPRDRQHILGHGELQPWNRTDPGANWPWAHFIERVRYHCGDGGTPPPEDPPPEDPPPTDPPPTTGGEIIIDSNNSRNDAALARIEVSANWNSSASTPGYFNTGYWWAQTASVSDGASFWFYLDSDQTRSVDAWWTAGSNRSASTPFVAVDSAGNTLGVAHQNQQINGKRWVTVGTWNFKAGWNRVILSRWTGAGKVVIADAMRVR